MNFAHSSFSKLDRYIYLHYTEVETKYKLDLKKLLKLISEKIIGNRAGRIELRLLKKRCNAYRLMTKARTVARVEVVKNGHLKCDNFA